MSYSIPDRQTFRSEQARHNELANIEWSEMKNIYTLTLRKRVIMVMVCRQDDDEKMDANLAYVVPVTPVDSCCVVS